MKVRHKATGVVTDVLGMVPAHEYEIVRDPTVPVTDQWQDVTEECHIAQNDHENEFIQFVETKGYATAFVPVSGKVRIGGYRLVKVRGCDLLPNDLAFRVERKRS